MKNGRGLMTQNDESQFIKHMDIIEFNPVMGNRKKIPLKFTRMEFISENLAKSSARLGQILVPCLGQDELHFVIKATSDSNYMIESLNQRPLFINNHWVFSALLSHGDRCIVAHNEFIFQKHTVGLARAQTLPISMNIIKSKIPILIEGETGTGKTQLAQLIHENSGVHGHFVHLNLSAFSSGVLESELFGHVRGAFTGALNGKDGALKKAHRGTLFLDEIDSISQELQTKLLLFLDNGKFSPVGSLEEYQIETRLIVASGQKLSALVETGRMRKDFYFRLRTGHYLRLPSLRENKEYIRQACANFMFKNSVMIEEKLVEYYQTKNWPGNYRQLIGHLKYKEALACNGYITYSQEDTSLIDDLPLKSMFGDERWPCLKDVKEKYIMDTYYHYQCDMQKAAEQLGISTKSLRGVVKNKVA